jgi:hypothetical protein
MPNYTTTWLDYNLPTGQAFAVAVCGYTGKVRHMYIGDDPLRRMLVQNIQIEDEYCQTAQHCLALDCPLNKSERDSLLHMLDMNEDEEMDPEAARQWGTESTLDCLLQFAQKMNQLLPEELRKRQEPVKE